MNPFISICIPTYNRIHFLKRLLDSIEIQSFKDFEVIITDDSDNSSVEYLVKTFSNRLPIKYFKNEKPVGTPANWNAAITKASGEWIKIMHDDDWFNNRDGLQLFRDATKQEKKFIFSAYKNVFDEKQTQNMKFSLSQTKKIIENPVILLSRNLIGPPSVTLIHRSISEEYNVQLKWRVDIEYYMRLLSKERTFEYIDNVLVNVGIGYTQVTNYCKDHPEVELPEGLVLLEEFGTKPLKNIWVYDAWWRILRNVHIKTKKQLLYYTSSENWPEVIFRMVSHQAKVPHGVLTFGPCSKTLMVISYLLNRKYL